MQFLNNTLKIFILLLLRTDLEKYGRLVVPLAINFEVCRQVNIFSISDWAFDELHSNYLSNRFVIS